MNAHPLKVLVVDDEPPIRKLLRMGLGTQGYQILDAPNAKAALGLMDDEPDLVILDPRPPRHAGPRVATPNPATARGRSHRGTVEPR